MLPPSFQATTAQARRNVAMTYLYCWFCLMDMFTPYLQPSDAARTHLLARDCECDFLGTPSPEPKAKRQRLGPVDFTPPKEPKKWWMLISLLTLLGDMGVATGLVVPRAATGLVRAATGLVRASGTKAALLCSDCWRLLFAVLQVLPAWSCVTCFLKQQTLSRFQLGFHWLGFMVLRWLGEQKDCAQPGVVF